MKNKLRIILLLLLLCPQINVSGQNTLATLADMHSVAKGETWESVAAHYGVSVAELQAANPDVTRKKLKKKTLLIIPKAHAPLASEGMEPSLPAGQIELTPLIRTSIPNLKVGVLLPFGQPKMVEFYRGFLMAADSAFLHSNTSSGRDLQGTGYATRPALLERTGFAGLSARL